MSYITNNHSFDKIYALDEGQTFGDIPSEELRDFILANKLCGNALDLGCGDGRDTLFLASVGFHVTAVDVSEIALKKLLKFAKLRGLEKKIQLIQCDVRYWEYPLAHFDLVTSATCFDHIPRKDHKKLLEQISMSIKQNGFLFLEVHTEDDPGFNRSSEKISELSYMILCYFQHNELLRLIAPEFDIIRYEEKIEEDLDHGEPHLHGFANVLSRKKK